MPKEWKGYIIAWSSGPWRVTRALSHWHVIYTQLAWQVRTYLHGEKGKLHTNYQHGNIDLLIERKCIALSIHRAAARKRVQNMLWGERDGRKKMNWKLIPIDITAHIDIFILSVFYSLINLLCEVCVYTYHIFILWLLCGRSSAAFLVMACGFLTPSSLQWGCSSCLHGRQQHHPQVAAGRTLLKLLLLLGH